MDTFSKLQSISPVITAGVGVAIGTARGFVADAIMPYLTYDNCVIQPIRVAAQYLSLVEMVQLIALTVVWRRCVDWYTFGAVLLSLIPFAASTIQAATFVCDDVVINTFPVKHYVFNFCSCPFQFYVLFALTTLALGAIAIIRGVRFAERVHLFRWILTAALLSQWLFRHATVSSSVAVMLLGVAHQVVSVAAPVVAPWKWYMLKQIIEVAAGLIPITLQATGFKWWWSVIFSCGCLVLLRIVKQYGQNSKALIKIPVSVYDRVLALRQVHLHASRKNKLKKRAYMQRTGGWYQIERADNDEHYQKMADNETDYKDEEQFERRYLVDDEEDRKVLAKALRTLVERERTKNDLKKMDSWYEEDADMNLFVMRGGKEMLLIEAYDAIDEEAREFSIGAGGRDGHDPTAEIKFLAKKIKKLRPYTKQLKGKGKHVFVPLAEIAYPCVVPTIDDVVLADRVSWNIMETALIEFVKIPDGTELPEGVTTRRDVFGNRYLFEMPYVVDASLIRELIACGCNGVNDAVHAVHCANETFKKITALNPKTDKHATIPQHTYGKVQYDLCDGSEPSHATTAYVLLNDIAVNTVCPHLIDISFDHATATNHALAINKPGVLVFGDKRIPLSRLRYTPGFPHFWVSGVYQGKPAVLAPPPREGRVSVYGTNGSDPDLRVVMHADGVLWLSGHVGPGDSGAPIFYSAHSKAYVVGFYEGVQGEMGYGYTAVSRHACYARTHPPKEVFRPPMLPSSHVVAGADAPAIANSIKRMAEPVKCQIPDTYVRAWENLMIEYESSPYYDLDRRWDEAFNRKNDLYMKELWDELVVAKINPDASPGPAWPENGYPYFEHNTLMEVVRDPVTLESFKEWYGADKKRAPVSVMGKLDKYNEKKIKLRTYRTLQVPAFFVQAMQRLNGTGLKEFITLHPKSSLVADPNGPITWGKALPAEYHEMVSSGTQFCAVAFDYSKFDASGIPLDWQKLYSRTPRGQELYELCSDKKIYLGYGNVVYPHVPGKNDSGNNHTSIFNTAKNIVANESFIASEDGIEYYYKVCGDDLIVIAPGTSFPTDRFIEHLKLIGIECKHEGTTVPSPANWHMLPMFLGNYTVTLAPGRFGGVAFPVAGSISKKVATVTGSVKDDAIRGLAHVLYTAHAMKEQYSECFESIFSQCPEDRVALASFARMLSARGLEWPLDHPVRICLGRIAKIDRDNHNSPIKQSYVPPKRFERMPPKKTKVGSKKPPSNAGVNLHQAVAAASAPQKVSLFRQLASLVPRGTLAAVGTAIGSAAGGAVGNPMVGGMVGRSAGSLISRVTGFGDYTIHSNTLMGTPAGPSQGAARFSMSEHGVRIGHAEMITIVYGSKEFATTTYPINAAQQQTFPFLSQIARQFDEYEVHGLIFQFISTQGSIAGTSPALGSVMMATQYDAYEDEFSTAQQLLSYQYSSSTVPIKDCVHGVECDPKQRVRARYYTRKTLEVQGSLLDYDIGKFTFATEGMQFAYPIGQLWVSYDVTLRKPRLQSHTDANAMTEFTFNTGCISNGTAGIGPNFFYPQQSWTSRYDTFVYGGEIPATLAQSQSITAWHIVNGQNATSRKGHLFGVGTYTVGTPFNTATGTTGGLTFYNKGRYHINISLRREAVPRLPLATSGNGYVGPVTDISVQQSQGYATNLSLSAEQWSPGYVWDSNAGTQVQDAFSEFTITVATAGDGAGNTLLMKWIPSVNSPNPDVNVDVRITAFPTILA